MPDVERRTALAAARAELDQRIDERQKIDNRILELRQIIISLRHAIISGRSGEARRGAFPRSVPDRSLMDDIRGIFQARRGKVLTAPDVLDELRRLGHDVDKYQQPLATIGVMLGRLKDKGEILSANGQRGFCSPR